MPGEDLAGADSPLSGALGDLDARLRALEKGGGQFAPGMVGWTSGDTAPPGWLIADGTAFDTARYAALAVIHPGGILPDLRDRFPIGAGNLYALLTTGGAATHVLTSTESGQPGIAAGVTGSTTPGNTGAGSSHLHTYNFPAVITIQAGATQNINAGAGTPTNTGAEATHTHPSAPHTHTTPAVAAASAAAAHSILNPYVALTPLVKF